MCSGRVDLSFVIRAFLNGMDGVLIGGCHLNECHYITDGNHHAVSMVQLCKKLLESIGLNPERLRMEFLSAGEGILFAEVVNDFSKKLSELGPLGEGEGISPDGLRFKLEAIEKLVPYIRLVERERIRVRFDTMEEYERHFRSEEMNRLFQELIADKLAMSQIMALLREKPRSTGEISEALRLSPSEASRYLGSSTRRGFVWFDADRKRFVPA
jgi:F420-non-reducing hydrogenase iron-sulfur subunit